VSNKPAETIDEVVERLTAIIERSLSERSRLGYFAALYRKVTVTVQEGIKDGLFDDGDRMEGPCLVGGGATGAAGPAWAGHRDR
jgi:hypothetical protein